MRTGIILLASGILICAASVVLSDTWWSSAGFLRNLQARSITLSYGEMAEPEAIGSCRPFQNAETGEYIFYARGSGRNMEVCRGLGVPETRRVNQIQLPIKYPFFAGIVLMVAGTVVAFLGRVQPR